MITWISENYIEILGVVFSLAYLWFSIRQNILLWPMGIMGAILYIFVFFQSKFYADMGLNVYYFFISIYGWVVWSKGQKSVEAGGHASSGEADGQTSSEVLTASGNKMPIKELNMQMAAILAGVTIILFLLTGWLLDRFTDSPLPYGDALTTAGSITATWMLARKYLEHWIIWVAIDALSIALYIYRGLYPTVVLFSVYTTMAVIGYIKWKKELKAYSA